MKLLPGTGENPDMNIGVLILDGTKILNLIQNGIESQLDECNVEDEYHRQLIKSATMEQLNFILKDMSRGGSIDYLSKPTIVVKYELDDNEHLVFKSKYLDYLGFEGIGSDTEDRIYDFFDEITRTSIKLSSQFIRSGELE